MAFHIKLEYSNGYRCCCTRTWDDEKWVDTLEEALEFIPSELEDKKPLPFNGDCEIKEVEVIDGETGDIVAWASTWWSQGYGRGSGYNYTRWKGSRPDTGAFDVVYSRRTKVADRTWDECIAELKEKHRAQELAKAEREKAEAEKRIRLYSLE